MRTPGRCGRSLDIDGPIVTMPAMDHAHPQLLALERRIGWFLAHPEHELCVVVEPESQSIVRFSIPLKSMRGYRSEKLGRVMIVELTPDEADAGAPILRRLGLQQTGQRKATFDGERNRVFPRYEKATFSAREAARETIAIMQDVFGTGDAWLWTFHLDDPNQWPDPLPKPDPWPPVALPSIAPPPAS